MSSVKNLLKEIGRSRSSIDQLDKPDETRNNHQETSSLHQGPSLSSSSIIQETNRNRDDVSISASTLKDLTESRSSFSTNSDDLESHIERLVNKKLDEMMKEKANITEPSPKKVQFNDDDDLKKPSLFSAESEFKTSKADFYKDQETHEFRSSTYGYPEKMSNFEDTYNRPTSSTQSNTNRNRPTTPWDEKSFIRSLFREVDTNGDGQLTNSELFSALRRGFQFVHGNNLTSQFDFSTVDALILKHDRDRDRLIDQFEFTTLYNDLNAKYLQFVEFSSYKTVNGVGYVSPNEMIEYMRSKGFEFNFELFEELIQDIMLKKGFNRNNGIDFDGFVRLASRLEYLKELYLKENRAAFERFIRDRFYAEISYF